MPDKLMSDDQDPDRRRSPDVMSYRVGAVEKLAETNREDIGELARTNSQSIALLDRLIRDFIAAAPAHYVTRELYDAHRNNDARQQQTLRLHWPVWVLMFLNILVAAGALATALAG